MNKIEQYFLILFSCIFLLFSCNTLSEQDISDTYRIGILMPESGNFAQYAESFMKGLECFYQTNNELFNKNHPKIELIYYDNQSDNEIAVKGCNYLINKEKVDFIIGPLTSKISNSVIPIGEKAGVPILPLWATADGLTAQSPAAFRIVYSNSQTGYLLAKFSIENLHSRKAAIIYDPDAYFHVESAEGFKEGYDELSSGDVQMFSITSAHKDIVKLLTEYQPDVIYLNFDIPIKGSSQLVSFISEVERNNIKTIFLGDMDWSTVDPIALYRKIDSDIYYINHFSPDSYEKNSQVFSQDYKDMYGIKPDGLAASGYEALSVVFQFFTQNPSMTGKNIVSAFQGGEYQGLLGKIKFDMNGDAFKSATILKISKEGNEYITTLKPDIFSVADFKKENKLLAAAVDTEKERLAVLELIGLNVEPIETQIVTELMGSSVIKLNRYTVIEAGQRDRIMEEWNFSLSGMNEEEIPFEIGKLITARMVITGSIAKSAERVILNLRLLDIETGVALYSSFKVFDSFDQILDDCEFLTYELLGRESY